MPALLDTAFNSLATFAVSLVATRYLRPAELGAYAISFHAFLAAVVVPTQLLLIPAEVAVLSVGRRMRLAALPSSLRAGAPAALAASVAAAAASAAAISAIGDSAVLTPAISMAAAATLSPLQDHVRRMFHQAGESWRATAVSGVQCLTALVVAALLLAIGITPLVLPFTALATANAISLLTATVIARPRGTAQPIPRLLRRQLVQSGRWLVTLGLLDLGCTFLAVVTVAALSGQEAAGYAEAARVLSQPVYVLAMGLAAVIGPEITLAARDGDHRRGVLMTRLFASGLAVASAVYLLAVGIEWRGTPMTSLFANAYHINGLLALSIVAQAVNFGSLGQRAELIGRRREAKLAFAGVMSGLLQLGVAVSSVAIGAFALPLGVVVAASVRAVAFQRILRAARQHPDP